jgi:tetratricopeptide (TPR) repeat protein
MANELQKISGYYDRKSAWDMDYRTYMEKQAMVKDIGTALQRSSVQQFVATAVVGSNIVNRLDKLQSTLLQVQTGVQTSIQAQTFAIVASQANLQHTFQQGFDQLNNTIDIGFAGVSNQLGQMTAAFSLGMARIDRIIIRMTEEICKRLDAIHDIVNNPLLTQSRELYRRSLINYTKGFYEESLEDIKAAVKKNKTDYISWFHMGKVYLFGAGEFNNVIDLDKALATLVQAAKYISPDITESRDARILAAEIWFYLGLARYSKFNELNFHKKDDEAKAFIAESLRAFEKSWDYSNDMLESLYNVARCKVIMGNVDNAIQDLKTIILRDRNYCIKVIDDSDFDYIQENVLKLIEQLKNNEFPNLKEKYDRINTILTEINNLNGVLTDSQMAMISENLPENLTSTMPYFDVLDNQIVFQEIIHELDPALASVKEKFLDNNEKVKRKNSFIALVEEDIKKISALSQSNTWLNKEDWEFIISKEKEYYISPPHFIPARDVEKIISIDDEGRIMDIEVLELALAGARSNDLISDPTTENSKIDLSLKNIIAHSDSEFSDLFGNIYTKPSTFFYKDHDVSYTYKLTLKPSLIEKFEILRTNKDLAELLISTVESAIEKQRNRRAKNERESSIKALLVSPLLLIASIIIGVNAHSFLLGLAGVVVAVIFFIASMVSDPEK